LGLPAETGEQAARPMRPSVAAVRTDADSSVNVTLKEEVAMRRKILLVCLCGLAVWIALLVGAAYGDPCDPGAGDPSFVQADRRDLAGLLGARAALAKKTKAGAATGTAPRAK